MRCAYSSAFWLSSEAPSGRVKGQQTKGKDKGKGQFEPICIHFILKALPCFGLHFLWKGWQKHQKQKTHIYIHRVFSLPFSDSIDAEGNQEMPTKLRDKGPWCCHHFRGDHGGSGGRWLHNWSCLDLGILHLGGSPKNPWEIVMFFGTYISCIYIYMYQK